MKDPKHPVGPAFHRAADELAAWRARMIAALGAHERVEHERLAEETRARRKDAERRFAGEREARVEAEKSRLLLEKPGMALRMLPSQRLRESIAYHKAADLVLRQHGNELETIERSGREAQDRFLKEREMAKAQEVKRLGEEFKDRSERDLGAALRARAAQRQREGRDRDPGRER